MYATMTNGRTRENYENSFLTRDGGASHQTEETGGTVGQRLGKMGSLLNMFSLPCLRNKQVRASLRSTGPRRQSLYSVQAMVFCYYVEILPLWAEKRMLTFKW